MSAVVVPLRKPSCATCASCGDRKSMRMAATTPGVPPAVVPCPACVSQWPALATALAWLSSTPNPEEAA